MHPDFSTRKAVLASLFSSAFLAACGGGGSDTGATTAQPADATSAAASAKLSTDSDAATAQAQSVRNSSAATLSSANVLVGSSTIQSSVDTNPDGMAEAFIFTAAASGTSGALNVYLDRTNTAQEVTLGVYADAAGVPGALLTSATKRAPVAGAWNTIPTAAIQIVAGTRYWIAILTPKGFGSVKMRDIESGGGGTVTSRQSTLAALPAKWSVGSNYSNSPVSAYLGLASVTTAPAPAPTPSPSPSPSPAPAPTPAPTPAPSPAPTPAPTPAPAPAPTPAPAPAPTTGTATLTWTPTVSSLVTGYRVYYGTASHTYVQAAGAGLYAGNVATYVVSALPKGHLYYFSVTSVDAAGQESPASNEVTKQIN